MHISEGNREHAFDVVKGFAMLCIIAGHFSDGFICRFVFTFHVPIFFLIGGYFFKSNRSRLKARILRLLKPYLFTVLAVSVLDVLKQLMLSVHNRVKPDYPAVAKSIARWFLAGAYGSGSRSDFFSLKMPVIGAIWFLLAFIWVLLFMEVLEHKTDSLVAPRKKAMQAAAASVLFLLGYWSARYFWLPFSVQSGCAALLFFIIGFWEKHGLSGLLRSKALLLAACVVWGASILVSVRHDYMSLVRCAFPDLLLNIAGACSATLVLLSVGNWLETRDYLPKTRFFLEWIGQNTLPFLCFHLIELNVFPWHFLDLIGLNNDLETIIIFCLKLIWCCACIALTKNIRLFHLIFG